MENIIENGTITDLGRHKHSDPVTGAYQTNAFQHGIGNSAVSSQWFSRPDDQKFLSLDDMLAHKKQDARSMNSRIVNTHKMQIVGQLDEANPSRGDIFVEYTDEQGHEAFNTPTNWSFGQLARTYCGGRPAMGFAL